MFDIGQKLKDARIRKGYSITDISKQTKIQERYLIAIEEGNLDILPDAFYARTFIKQYAEMVDFDSAQIVREFDEKTDEQEPKPKQKRTITHKSIKDSSSGTWATIKESLPLILLSCFILAIVVVVYVAGQNLSREAEEAYIQNKQEETRYIEDAVIEDVAEEEATNYPQTIELADEEGTAIVYTVAGEHPEPQRLVINVVGEEAYAVIYVDGQPQELDPSESLEAEFSNDVSEVTVEIGGSEKTTVSLNEQPVTLPDELVAYEGFVLTLQFEHEADRGVE